MWVEQCCKQPENHLLWTPRESQIPVISSFPSYLITAPGMLRLKTKKGKMSRGGGVGRI
jgi:hypothetical protein